MKIAVMFGSFNPFTNAHLAAIKTAVETLQADKGLFVATNGQYLRRKTVKTGDPFYLTEDERKEIIEKTCAGEEKLSFWGFEMGGTNPARYKTLCKIQKQYPDAQLYEIQGADKVRSDSRAGSAEDYLANIRFAVFDRDDIDLEQTFAADSLLSRYQDSFILLPALPEAESSSTAVRKRFYAGEDCSGMVPAAAADVLARHDPSEFAISYEERMKTIMASGRYGINQAQKKVYIQNTDLFRRWKDGQLPQFGNYRAYLDGAKLYKTAYDVTDLGNAYHDTKTGCVNADCVDVAQQLIDAGYHPAILNLASAGRPGGGYDLGLGAQEESLCQSSNLSLSLYQFADPRRLKCVRDSGVPHKQIGYPLDTNYGGIYTPGVTFFRNGRRKYFTIKDDPFRCDVITVAALSFNGRNDFARATELMYKASDGGFTPAGAAVMRYKIRTIFRMGVEHGKDALVLGAFGCGAYKLPSDAVAALFRQVMDEPEFAGKFRLLVFAIRESTRKPHGLEGKFAPFYREFGTFHSI